MYHKIYIDLGAFVGGTIKEFYETHSDASEYLIYAWEPLLNNYKVLTRNVAAMGWDNVIPLFYAASNKDGNADFYTTIDKKSDGGTLVNGKLTGRLLYDKPVPVKCKDFCKWFIDKGFIENCGDYYICLKMNIEGGEYEIMDDMIDTGILDSIDEFKFWLHLEKIGDSLQKAKYEQTHNRFLKELERNGNLEVIRMS